MAPRRLPFADDGGEPRGAAVEIAFEGSPVRAWASMLRNIFRPGTGVMKRALDDGNLTTFGHRRIILANDLGPIGLGSAGKGGSPTGGQGGIGGAPGGQGGIGGEPGGAGVPATVTVPAGAMLAITGV